MLGNRLLRFLGDPAADRFEDLALAAIAFQYENIAPYRELCDRRGVKPAALADWRGAPAIPALAFKSVTLTAAPAREVFRSSGTTGAAPSVHHHPYPDLYRAVIDASFPAFCLPHLGPGARPPILSLIPSRSQAPHSSLAFMADHVIGRWGAPESAVAFAPQGVDVRATRGWLAARQRAGRPALVLATGLALADLLDVLERLDLRFRLPAGSAVFETGGTKGRRREVPRAELLGRLEERLGVPPPFLVREYGMTELTSQCYTRALTGGDPDLFVTPHWVRVRVLDPVTLQEAAPGEAGLVAVFDLANLGSAVHLLTEDLGAAEGEGFRLIGRAAGAELRGCSLAVEELEASERRDDR